MRVWRSRRIAARITGLLLILLLAAPTAIPEAAAQGAAPGIRTGPSGFPLPRFVSLKASRVNVRVGPGEDYDIAWVFTRSGLPVEVVQEFDNWRRIRDSDGAEGWVFHSLLTGKRTAVVAPWESSQPVPLRAAPDATAEITYYLEPKVVGAVNECEKGWCRLSDKRFRGWMEQDRLWGVYPDETVE